MGSPESESERCLDEARTEVRLTRGFWCLSTCVTQAMWKTIMNSTPWLWDDRIQSDSSFPAVSVSFNAAQEFCREFTMLAERSDNSFAAEMSLPTEAQWEYACRAGTNTAYSFGNHPKQLSEYGWYNENAGHTYESYPHEVASKRPNAWNIYDCHGNVLEWCLDAYAEYVPGGSDPLVTSDGDRVTRGGCYHHDADNCRSAARSSFHTDCSHIGFRVVLIVS